MITLRLVAALVLAAALAVPADALAAPGDLVAGFGSGGRALVDFGGDEHAEAVLVQGDGRIVVAGSTNVGANPENFAIARLTTSGTTDGGFGTGGKTILDFGKQDLAHGAALASDGKILLAGATGTDFGMARLLAGGTPDLGFGSTLPGRRVENFDSGDDTANAIAVAPDGRIVVAGVTSAGAQPTQTRVGLTRMLAASGGADVAFGGNAGLATFGDPVGASIGNAVAVQPDGRIVVAGTLILGAAKKFLVARLVEPNGALDPTFNTNEGGGKIAVQFGPTPDDVARAVAVRADGKIVVAGQTNTGANEPNFGVMRLHADGTLDRAFSDFSIFYGDFGATERGNAMALAPDGKIILAGETRVGPNPPNIAVVRLTAEGAPDTSFGAGGQRIIDFGAFEIGFGVAVAPNGNIVVAGIKSTGTNPDMAVAMLEGDAPPPASQSNPGAPAIPAIPASDGGDTTTPQGAPTRCGGKAVTRLGSAGADRITGTRRRDVIAALGGNDVINGLGGSDIVCAGAGRDRILGGSGDDVLQGSDGTDTLSGGTGKDRLSGGAGNDQLSGGAGSDRLTGGAGNDRLLGGPSRDILSGGPGRDRLVGGPGRDIELQ